MVRPSVTPSRMRPCAMYPYADTPLTVASCVQPSPGLISGFKLRLVGSVVQERGKDVVHLARCTAPSEFSRPAQAHTCRWWCLRTMIAGGGGLADRGAVGPG